MSSGSRESSPDWLRHFQTPTQAAVTLSSYTDSPLSDDEDGMNLSTLFKKPPTESPDKKDDDFDGQKIRVDKTPRGKSCGRSPTDKQVQAKKRKRGNLHVKEEEKGGERGVESEELDEPILTSAKGRNHSAWLLSSDSDSESRAVSTNSFLDKNFCETDRVQDMLMENDEVALLDDATTTKNQLIKKEIPGKVNPHLNGRNTGDLVVDEDTSEKRSGLHVSSSRLPLVLSEKVLRTKALVECEGDSIDLSGDVGAVGRVVISGESSEDHEMLLDLKGTIYGTTIVPSRTFCVVNFGQSEAKIEAVMNDFIQLKPQSNVYEAETMVEGTLEGLLFDSEDEVDDLPKTVVKNQNRDAEEQSHGKKKPRAEKTSVAARKVKTAAARLPKKAKKKSLAPKKSKTKK